MSPVTLAPVNSAVSHDGQIVATVATVAAAVATIALVVRLCRRERVTWPLVVLAGGTVTCLLEPLFDHLYGLWFPSRGEWIAFTTYGVHEPDWLPAAYLVVYGGLAVAVVRLLQREPTRRTVWRCYVALVGIAIVAEIMYVKVLGVYNYQHRQSFVVLGYPLFLGFVNSMSALIGGIATYRLVPLLRGRSSLSLALVPPLAFGVDAIGSGFIYLAVRNSPHPPMLLVHLAAVTVAVGGAATVRLMTLLLPDAPASPEDSSAPAGEPVVQLR